MAGIYIHIPFCKQACIYCNFHFKSGNHNTIEISDAIRNELQIRRNYLDKETINTIYFGGGTPSLLSVEEIEKILETIHANFQLSQNPEITLECNPDDLTIDKIKGIKHAGINRLSIGTQSFNAQALKWMNRAHNAKESEICIQMAQDFGFNNISIDIITGIPHSSENLHLHDIQKALSFNVQHISCYSMTLEPNTTWARQVARKIAPSPNDNTQAKAFEVTMQYLIDKNWLHYEISNFACSENYISQHNSSYWKGEKYLGVGPSAHSFNQKERRWNLNSHTNYIQKIRERKEPPFDFEEITNVIAFNEHLMTGLRTMYGVDLIKLTEIHPQASERLINKIDKKNSPHLHLENNKLYLKPTGKLFADAIASELFEEE